MKTIKLTRENLIKYISKERLSLKKSKNKDMALAADYTLFNLQKKFDLFEL